MHRGLIKMRKTLCCLALLMLCGEKSAVADEAGAAFLDLREDSALIWEHLFKKINILLSESTKHSEMLNTLTENLEKINKRQDEFERKMSSFMESTQKQLTDLKQDVKMTTLVESTEKHFTDLIKREEASEKLLKQYCNNNAWTTVLRRQDGSVNFNRNWTDYKQGFGNPQGEFFIGLERLHALTTNGAPQELMIVLKDFENETRIAKYDLFQVAGESEKYTLKELGTFSGDAKDSLYKHKDVKFSTPDQDNDTSDDNCAKIYESGWWFYNCYLSNLNGVYKSANEAKTAGVGWNEWKGKSSSIKYAEMKIRSKLV